MQASQSSSLLHWGLPVLFASAGILVIALTAWDVAGGAAFGYAVGFVIGWERDG